MSDFLNSIIERLNSSASVKSVYGEPVVANGTTIVPVARISYGFGGGSGKHAHPDKPDRQGEGGGGGGGVNASPVGVFEITANGARFVPADATRKLLAACLVGFCLGLMWAKTPKSQRGLIE